MLIWLSLTLAVLLVVGSLVVLTLRGLEAFRAFKRLGRTIGEEAGRLAAAGGGIERHLELAGESGTRLSASLERLSASRARLNVLTSALDDAKASLGRITSVYPRK